MDDLTNILREVTSNGFMDTVEAAFADMRRADAILRDECSQNPKRAQDIDRLFRFCQRTPELMSPQVAPKFYQRHIEELVWMVLEDERIDQPTSTEKACGLLAVATEVPLAEAYRRWLLVHSPMGNEMDLDTEGIEPLDFVDQVEVEDQLKELFGPAVAWRAAYYQVEEYKQND